MSQIPDVSFYSYHTAHVTRFTRITLLNHVRISHEEKRKIPIQANMADFRARGQNSVFTPVYRG